MTHLVTALGRAAARHRFERKWIVAPNHAAGRELLRLLALSGKGWIGFEVTTPHGLAHRLAQRALGDRGMSVLDAFELQALLDRALDSALAAEGGELAKLSEGIGFRDRVHGAIHALRMAGVGPKELDAARFAQWEKKLFLLRVLQRYERLLAEGRRADSAEVLRIALAALEDAGGTLPAEMQGDVVLLVPGLSARGLSGAFLSALGARGARLLETDPVEGLDVPGSVLWGRCGPPAPGSYLHAPEEAVGSVGGEGGETIGADRGEGAGQGVAEETETLSLDFFRAASTEAELREVLRRALAGGLRWDEVEIVTPDPAAYGSALHALGTRLGIPVTYAVGLPVQRTRTGRVAAAYLGWIEEGFHADPIRRLLEAGDLRPPRSHGFHAPAALARRFRSLRVGWGRKRYRSQIRSALAGVERMEPSRRESEERFERRRQRARAELEALRAILFPALKATPAVPDRMGEGEGTVSPAELARGLRAFLRRVPRGRGPDRSAREEVDRILERVEATLTRRTEFRAAVAILRRYLEVRVRPELVGDDSDGAGAPWASASGALHLSDVEHGGFTGRRATFLVGLDAERMPGTDGQDPVLLDGDRRVLGDALPTSAEVLTERIFRFAALFARLRGDVTLSFCSWQATEARTIGPSAPLLRALRLAERDPTLTFEHLRERTERVVSAIPLPGHPSLDVDDVWMRALGSGAVMLHGIEAVRDGFPWLDRGHAAAAERLDGVPGPVHGVVGARDGVFDPRADESIVVSASRMEKLGACALRYLHESVLRMAPPDDPSLDPDVWLDPLRRGSLLHAVYERSSRALRDEGIKPDEARFEALALEVLHARVARLRDEVPSPGEGTLAREIAGLEEDVRSFVRMVREAAPRIEALELSFGLDGDEPVALELGEGTVRLRGAIDRVDRTLGGLHVIDYKTGSAYGYGQDVFAGGRRLQHAIYAHAAEQRLNDVVVDGQYHFPTRRGQNQAFSYERATLARVAELLGILLDGIAGGYFVPTDDANDCTFCDFASVCRVRLGEYGKTHSPLADWSKEHANAGMWPAFHPLKRARAFEE